MSNLTVNCGRFVVCFTSPQESFTRIEVFPLQLKEHILVLCWSLYLLFFFIIILVCLFWRSLLSFVRDLFSSTEKMKNLKYVFANVNVLHYNPDPCGVLDLWGL
jgi:predicted permease